MNMWAMNIWDYKQTKYVDDMGCVRFCLFLLSHGYRPVYEFRESDVYIYIHL